MGKAALLLSPHKCIPWMKGYMQDRHIDILLWCLHTHWGEARFSWLGPDPNTYRPLWTGLDLMNRILNLLVCGQDDGNSCWLPPSRCTPFALVDLPTFQSCGRGGSKRKWGGGGNRCWATWAPCQIFQIIYFTLLRCFKNILIVSFIIKAGNIYCCYFGSTISLFYTPL